MADKQAGVPFALIARDLRGGKTENWHQGAIAVVTPEGELVASVGDPDLPAFMRSAAKPFQAMPLVTAGGVERFRLGMADLALICSSHSGTEAHTERAASLLGRAGRSVEDLLCGSHLPFDAHSRRALRESGEAPTPLHNNCSGKHAGMLSSCVLLGLPIEDYIASEHPLQRLLLAEMARWAGLAADEIDVGIDGCSLPTFLMPLRGAARAYAGLADPAAAGHDAELSAAAAQVVEAMTGVPEMVAGPGRFTTRLMQATGGRVLGKEGAQGYYSLAVRGPVALGIAVKVADGDLRCRDGVVIDVLRQLGALSAVEFEELAEFHRVPITNRRGFVVGEVVPDVELV
jgi:L-asparaginase II